MIEMLFLDPLLRDLYNFINITVCIFDHALQTLSVIPLLKYGRTLPQLATQTKHSKQGVSSHVI